MAVAMEGGINRIRLYVFIPGYNMKSTYFMECKKVLGVRLKQNLWRYCISYVYVLYLVIFV